MHRIALLVLTLAFGVVAAANPDGDADAGRSAAPSAASAFEKLSGLVGDWRGRFADGREHTVSYRLSAGGSVLVETWALAPGRESMTLYHLDGDRLLATHYCPQGNQPTLRLASDKKPGRLSFVFDHGSNLSVPGRSHQHAMWIELDGARAFTRSETYVENGTTADQLASVEEGAAIVYARRDPDAGAKTRSND